MKLLIYSRTSMLQPLRFENGQVHSVRTLPDIWWPVDAVIKANPRSRKRPLADNESANKNRPLAALSFRCVLLSSYSRSAVQYSNKLLLLLDDISDTEYFTLVLIADKFIPSAKTVHFVRLLVNPQPISKQFVHHIFNCFTGFISSGSYQYIYIYDSLKF